MNYDLLRKQTNQGWNTWNTLNLLSYAHLPEGFCINLSIHEACSSRRWRECLIGRGGEKDEVIISSPRSYDGSYTELTVKFEEVELRVKSTVVDDEQIIVIYPLTYLEKKNYLVIEACLMWSKEGIIAKKDGEIYGQFENRTFKIYCTGDKADVQNTYSLSPYFAVALNKPIVVSTKPCTLKEAETLLDNAKVALDAKNNSFGKHSEAYTAMKTCLAWDTIYECEKDRICSTVSRIWNVWFGGYVLFDWDTYFAAIMASLEDKNLAILNAMAITNEITPDGFIPNFGAAQDYKSYDRSEPPVGSLIFLELYKKFPENWFLEEAFSKLLSWNEWYYNTRSVDGGYMCWGSNPVEEHYAKRIGYTHNRQGAAYESGLDNSPMYDDMEFDNQRNIMLLADVGLMGLYILDCDCLIEIAKIIGKDEIISEIIDRKNKVEAKLETMWDEQIGLYLNKDLRDGSLSRRLSPTLFYALNSSLVSDNHKKRMIDEHFYNPNEFYGEFIMPMISRDDPAYSDQEYWRGRIWAPGNCLVYMSMKKCGLKQPCNDLAEKSEQLLLKEWRLYGHVHENYNGDSGMGCDVISSDKFYHWGGLLAYIAIDNETW